MQPHLLRDFSFKWSSKPEPDPRWQLRTPASGFFSCRNDQHPPCCSYDGEVKEMVVATEKNIAILVENDYQDQEVWYPYYRLKEEGFNVVTVGTRGGEIYTSKHGYPVKAQLGPEAVIAGSFDAVVIPGGWAPDRLRQNAQLVRFVREMFDTGKIVAAICHAGWMLVSADILKGKTATSYIAIRDDMRAAGCTWVDSETAIDGNLITARKPDDLPRFVRAVIDALCAK